MDFRCRRSCRWTRDRIDTDQAWNRSYRRQAMKGDSDFPETFGQLFLVCGAVGVGALIGIYVYVMYLI